MCNILMYILFVGIFLITIGVAVPKKEHEDHYKDGEHNIKYDGQSFLGDESKDFESMSVQEKKERLSKIVDKIDKDIDGFVTEHELKAYIKYMQNKYVKDDTNRHWNNLVDAVNAEPLNWTYYVYKTYGVNDTHDISKEYLEMIDRDKRRWDGADVDKNNMLNKEEFTIFLHPEEQPHMKDIIVEESFYDIDKNKDGRITLDEYIGDMYVQTEGEKEPEWVLNERQQFIEFRDADKDGTLDREELKNWLMPDAYDNAEAEALHLIRESDTNADDKLTKDEILERLDIFTGSQVTDYGQSFSDHDEL